MVRSLSSASQPSDLPTGGRREAPKAPPSGAGGHAAIAIECQDVDLSYGAVRAVKDVSLSLPAGKIHAVVGQNGAGKSSLAHVLAGLKSPDAGAVSVGELPLRLGDVRDARRLGVEIVQQHFSLPKSLSVAETLELFGPTGRGIYRRRSLHRHWQGELAEFGIEIDPTARIGDLPVETVQLFEITRALLADAKVLILDEPTALLSPDAIDRLFARLRVIAGRGVTVVVVLHKLREVYDVAETVSVMRNGGLVLGPQPLAQITQAELIHAMTGEAAAYQAAAAAQSPLPLDAPVRIATAEPLLKLSAVTTRASAAEPGLDGISLTVAPGEIVGVAGVAGNGQRQLVEVVAGLTEQIDGVVWFDGRDLAGVSAGDRRRQGLALVPFDRTAEALSKETSLWENVAIKDLVTRSSRRPRLLPISGMRKKTDELLTDWSVSYFDVRQAAGTLSGGNAQRVVLARELRDGVRLVVIANPTTGLDLASTGFVHATLERLRSDGVAILLVSPDLDELMKLSDRIAVMLNGRIAADMAPPYAIAEIGAAMLREES